MILYKVWKNGYNDNSQKIRKYLSSPKEAPENAETAFSGASAILDSISPFVKQAFGAFLRNIFQKLDPYTYIFPLIFCTTNFHYFHIYTLKLLLIEYGIIDPSI